MKPKNEFFDEEILYMSSRLVEKLSDLGILKSSNGAIVALVAETLTLTKTQYRQYNKTKVKP